MKSPPKQLGIRIGVLSKETGVSVDAIRFYEREGLLPPPNRKGAVHHRGYRLYGEEAAIRVGFIRRAKELGFTLDEIGGLLAIQDMPTESCMAAADMLRAKLEDVERRIADLRKLRRALARWTEMCARGELRGPCPLLESLAAEKGENG